MPQSILLVLVCLVATSHGSVLATFNRAPRIEALLRPLNCTGGVLSWRSSELGRFKKLLSHATGQPFALLVVEDQHSPWEFYRWRIFGLLALVGLETLVIAFLLRDYSKRKREKIALKDEGDELLQAQRLSQLTVWRWDPKSDVLTCSDTFFELTDFDPSGPALLLKDLARFFSPESWKRLAETMADSLQTGSAFELELEGHRANRNQVRIMVRGEAVRDASDHIIQLRGTMQNISEWTRDDELPLKHTALVASFEDAIISKNLNGIIVSWNLGAQRMFGFSEAEVVGQPLAIIIPQELQEEEQRILQRIKAGEHIEHCQTTRLSKDGKRIRVSISISPVRDVARQIVGACSIARDITQEKQAKAALAELSGRLLQAQEQERSRIARELHDDISQRLALLVNCLTELNHSSTEPTPEDKEQQVEALLRLTNDIANDVQNLSHRLHPSKLNYVGLASAVRQLCQEFSRQHKVDIECQVHDLPRDIGENISLSLFRIIQESLRNVVKHSHAEHVKVDLTGLPHAIRLRVSDDGVGFDSDHASSCGLGLVSMQERLRSVGGELSIWSRPSLGTQVEATVPVQDGVARSA